MKVGSDSIHHDSNIAQDSSARRRRGAAANTANAANVAKQEVTNASQNAQESKKPASIAESRKASTNAAASIGDASKTLNNTIGSLEVMIGSLKSLQSQSKDLTKLANKLQKSKDEQDSEDIIEKSNEIKTQMKEVFDSAKFDDENVFYKNYAAIIPESKIEGKKAAPTALDIKKLDNLKDYASELSAQKRAAKEAQSMLKMRINSELGALNSANYEQLDRSKLSDEGFKAAQSGRGITLDRVVSLLK
ncbi:hypothetical protein BKN38_09590 [Helicobacter sp. CLO-3]|uniref:hypothetical protein n=1 Tax=unclassified Helicobacter TaxID=2593540 RepID=UPI000805D0A8|nr:MULTISPECIES: hypothetical protein [unclassified Helicobacter]OBV28577.1 hypothetical protein BA723_08930 [Helicobacter sp. CLO-3]OHU81157.1 hypothetical protein BKN38_09590 [Helicobacter sp. CLO-3]